jgi:potassium-transporting ATPase potassium-binding subunit
MTYAQLGKIAVYFLLILAVTKPLGLFLRRVFAREKTILDPLLRPIERLVYRVGGVDETREHDWVQYTIAMLVFSGVGLLFTYAIERLQHVLPLNPDKLAAVAPDLAWNTAVSFTTNTNW